MRVCSRRLVGLALAAALAAGCENKSSVVGPVATGTLLKDGAKYPIQAGDEVTVEFVTLGPDGKPGGASFRVDVDYPTATFKTDGPTSEGIPAGKYKVRVRHINEKLKKSYLPARLGGDDTPLEVEVTDPPKGITLDLGAAPAAK